MTCQICEKPTETFLCEDHDLLSSKNILNGAIQDGKQVKFDLIFGQEDKEQLVPSLLPQEVTAEKKSIPEILDIIKEILELNIGKKFYCRFRIDLETFYLE